MRTLRPGLDSNLGSEPGMSMPPVPHPSATPRSVARTTAIEWTDATWNPVTGCTKVSEGCLNCYIERTPPFRMAHRKFDQPGIGGSTGVKLYSDRLAMPLGWKKPRRVFVNSLSDLFHDDIPDAFIAEVFSVMARTPQHVFQVLTKRPGRMRSLLSRPSFRDNLAYWGQPWPLPNVWLGVSVESQKWADIRIPQLLGAPAAVRWLSCEPLLGPVDLHKHDDGLNHWLPDYGPEYDDGSGEPVCQAHGIANCWQGCASIDWVVVGGESGPRSRPMHPGWARSLRDQCVAAGVPFFFKQWGEWAPTGWRGIGWVGPKSLFVGPPITEFGEREEIERVGKKAAGRELDGRTWDEYPVGR